MEHPVLFWGFSLHSNHSYFSLYKTILFPKIVMSKIEGRLIHGGNQFIDIAAAVVKLLICVHKQVSPITSL